MSILGKDLLFHYKMFCWAHVISLKRFFSLMYSWCTVLYKLQVYSIVIHSFWRLYSIMVMITCCLYSLCYTVHHYSFFYICSSLYFLIPYPYLTAPTPLSPLVTTSLFSIVNIYLNQDSDHIGYIILCSFFS